MFFFFFGSVTSYNRHGHNLVLLKFKIKQLESKFTCLESDLYQHEIEANCVSQSKMAAKA